MEKHYITKSGLDVYSYETPGLNKFCLSLYIKAGKLYEGESETGITHYLEHMIFRRMGRYSYSELNRELDRLGLDFIGYTSAYYMRFEMTGHINKFKEGVRLFMNVFEPFSATRAEADKELNIIAREIYEDGDNYSSDYFCSKLAWEGTPLVRSTLGEEWKLRRMSMEKLRMKKEQLFSAGNMFVYATGDIGGMLGDLYAAAETAKVGRSELRQHIAPVPCDFARRDIKTLIKSSNFDFIGLSFDIDFSKFTKEETDILLNLIFTLSSSRVYNELIDTGLIYDYEYYLETFENIGRVCFEIETEDVATYEALATIMRMFRRVQVITADEYENAVLYSSVNAELRADDALALNSCNSKSMHIHGQTYKSIDEEKALCRAVTKARLEQMARETFIPDNLCLALRTTAKLEYDKIRSIVLESLI